MSMKYGEWLVFVAIVTSAIVMHIRQQALDAESAQGGPQAVPSLQREKCDPADARAPYGAPHVIAASCKAQRREQPVDERGIKPAVQRHPLVV